MTDALTGWSSSPDVRECDLCGRRYAPHGPHTHYPPAVLDRYTVEVARALDARRSRWRMLARLDEGAAPPTARELRVTEYVRR